MSSVVHETTAVRRELEDRQRGQIEAKRRLRILVVANLPPHVMGGAENQVARLIEGWVLHGHTIEVAGHSIHTGTQAVGSVKVRTHRIQTFHRLGRPGRAISYAFSLARIAWHIRRRIDVIYCRGLGDGALVVAALKALRVLQTPMVACPINARGAGDVYFIRSIPGWRLWTRLIDRHCNAINLIASGIADDLRMIGIQKPQIYRIPNGIALGDPPLRESVSAVRRLCWTGRITTQKGLDLLQPALSIIAAEGIKFRMEIIGEGPGRAELTTQARTLGLEGRIQYLDRLPETAIRRKLAAADIFVLPSRFEGMSNSALEAMEAGLPVLCTLCGGIDEYVIDGAGWVCAPGSIDALANALRSLFSTPDTQVLAMGRRARQIVETNFALPDVVASNLALLQSVATTTRAV